MLELCNEKLHFWDIDDDKPFIDLIVLALVKTLNHSNTHAKK